MDQNQMPKLKKVNDSFRLRQFKEPTCDVEDKDVAATQFEQFVKAGLPQQKEDGVKNV